MQLSIKAQLKIAVYICKVDVELFGQGSRMKYLFKGLWFIFDWRFSKDATVSYT